MTIAKSENNSVSSPDANINLMYASAAAGLECVFDGMESSQKTQVYKHLSHHLRRLVGEITDSIFGRRSSSRFSIARDSGLLASNIMVLMLLWNTGNAEDILLLKPSFLSNLVQVIIIYEQLENIHGYTSSNMKDPEICHWMVARTQALQFLSNLMRNKFTKDTLNVSWKEIILSVNRLVKDKRSEFVHRKMLGEKCDVDLTFAQVLDGICLKNSDQVASVFAKKIKARLGWYLN